MMLLRNECLAVCVLLSAAVAVSDAHAQARVGEAVVVQKEVLHISPASTSQMSVGDGVLRDETVRTGAESATRLVMADSTNLSLGANASLTLDRTVFNDERTYRDIAVKMTSGAFRFVTGHSEKAAYKISTPLATIGVRGTILDILSQRGKTTVVLQEGGSHVCNQSGSQCIELDPARRHRDHHLVRPGPEHDQEDQHSTLDFRAGLRGVGRSLRRH